MTELVAVMVAGGLGAGARFVVDHVVSQASARVLPAGTLVVNVAGSLAAGLLAGLVVHHGLDETSRVVVGTGFLGAFTTFSTFAVETLRLAEEHAGRHAVVNAAATVVLTLAAATVGFVLVAAA